MFDVSYAFAFFTAVAADDGLAFSINLHKFLEEKNWKDEKSTFSMYVCMRAFPHSQRVCWMLLYVKYTKSH